MDLSEYCRELEAHLCRKNDGHLIRIAGPSFELVSRWAEQGVPLKVAMGGIDRYFERYYRKGPRRRPVRIEFCEADVLDLFDQWRRSTGVSTAHNPVRNGGVPEQPRRRGPSLREHLERVLVRLSSLRATGTLGDELDPVIDRVSSELDATKSRSAVRGEMRSAVIARLHALDEEMIQTIMRSADRSMMAAIEREAAGDLAPFRTTMPAEAYEAAAHRAAIKGLRERLHLPVIAVT